MKDLKVYVGGQTVDQWGTFKRNQKILNNKKADKYDKKEAKENINKIKELFNI